MRALIPLTLCLSLAVLAPLGAQTSVLYGSEVALDDLGAIDRTTGAWTLVGSQVISGSITGLAYDANGGVLYGCSPNNNSLYVLDKNTGVATIVGATGFSNINGLAFDTSTNTLYCTDLNGNNLFTIDVNTGAGTLVAQISGATAVEGLGYDAANDILYGLDDNADVIVILDKNTAVATPLPNGLSSSGLWRGLTYDGELGVLWATKVNPGHLHMVDPLTGSSTFVGTPQPFVQGLAFEGAVALPPEYQVNQAGASLDVNGIQGTAQSPAVVNLGVNQVGMVNFASANLGQLWDVVVGSAPLLSASQGAPSVGPQLINVDLLDPTLALLYNGFQSAGFVPFSGPIFFSSPITLSFQMAVLDPNAIGGLSFSQPVRLIVQ
jgi:hypothetical protein